MLDVSGNRKMGGKRALLLIFDFGTKTLKRGSNVINWSICFLEGRSKVIVNIRKMQR